MHIYDKLYVLWAKLEDKNQLKKDMFLLLQGGWVWMKLIDSDLRYYYLFEEFMLE